MLKKGGRGPILPEYQNKGDNLYVWVVVGDKEKGRIDISPINLGLPLIPVETVPSCMEAPKKTSSGRRVSIMHSPLAGLVK